MKCVSIFDVLHGDIQQEKLASETTNFSGICPDIPSHVPACLDLLEIAFGCFEGTAKLKIFTTKN